MSGTTSESASASARNEVRLVGRVTSAAVEHTLPSGDTVMAFRVVVARERTPMTAGSKQKSDWVDCAVWGGRVRRAAATWQVGDLVEVEGSLRRRFYRSADGGGGSRVEVEVLGGRRVARAA